MKRVFTVLLFLHSAILGAWAAGPHTSQVLIVSGGKFGDPNNYVRVGSYNPSTGVFTLFDSIHAASTKTAIISKQSLGRSAYITADTVIVKYDMITHTRKAVSPSAKGITYLAEYVNKQTLDTYIVATRGYGADSDYVNIYKASDLSFVSSIKGISGQAAGITVYEDSAFVAVPGSFGTKTRTIAVIDLKTMMLKREIALDTLGEGIDKLFGAPLSDANAMIYAVNGKHDYLISLNPASGQVTFTHLSSDIGRAFYRNRNGLYMEVNDALVAEYSFAPPKFSDDTVFAYANVPGVTGLWDIASVSVDEMPGMPFASTYVSATDFFSYGKVFVLDKDGMVKDTIVTGISPEAIAFYREAETGIKDDKTIGFTLNLYPNPSSTQITCILPANANGSYSIISSTGQVIRSNTFANTNTIKANVQDLHSGLYFMQVNTQKGTSTTRFVRQ